MSNLFWYYSILKLVWAVGFAQEQPLHVVAFSCSASGILKQLEHIALSDGRF
ncbi:MAG: hypothetical protein LBJ00_15005 [Planctomycetaceae bacterium]|nr:hypothetical protein [Planctomycetaceae bacterium]